MATIVPNVFTSYVLTEQEQIEGSILTIAQKEVIQNRLSDTAAEKLALPFDPSNPMEFAQEEAYKRGHIDALQFILDVSEAAVAAKTS